MVALGPHQSLKTIEAGPKGLGLTTTTKILKGQFVCEYAGEIITNGEATARLARKSSEKSSKNYIFLVNEVVPSPEGSSSVEIRTVIDAEKFGNVGRYVNHSCEPNLEKYVVRTTDVVPHLSFFAKRDILPGEELTVSYAGLSDGAQQSTENGSRPCFCGATSCVGIRPFQVSLNYSFISFFIKTKSSCFSYRNGPKLSSVGLG